MSWKYEVKVYNDPKFYNNAVRFATEDEAKRAADHKLMSWTAAEDVRVLECEDAVNYVFTNDSKLMPVDSEKQF